MSQNRAGKVDLNLAMDAESLSMSHTSTSKPVRAPAHLGFRRLRHRGNSHDDERQRLCVQEGGWNPPLVGIRGTPHRSFVSDPRTMIGHIAPPIMLQHPRSTSVPWPATSHRLQFSIPPPSLDLAWVLASIGRPIDDISD